MALSADLDPARAGAALGAFIRERAAAGREPLRFAVVHPHSGHNYELRYWLAACGIDPSATIEIVIVPPPFMADALAAGRIDGYCVGEPWNSAAVAAGTGHIVTVKALMWQNSPEKVIGVRKAWADENPEALAALLRALHHSARWCQDPANHAELAAVMAQPGFLGLPPAVQMPILTGHLQLGGGAERISTTSSCPSTRRRTFRGRAMRCGSTRRWCAGGMSRTRRTISPLRAMLPARPLPLGAEAAWRRTSRRQCEGRGRAEGRDRGRRDRGRPGARSRRFLRWPDLRSRRDRRLHCRARNRPARKPDHFRAILVHCTKIVRAFALMNNLWLARPARSVRRQLYHAVDFIDFHHSSANWHGSCFEIIRPFAGHGTGVQWRAPQAKLPLRSTRDPGWTDARGLAGGFFVLAETNRRADPEQRPTGDDDEETDRDWNIALRT